MKKTLVVIAALIGGSAVIVVFGLFALQRRTPDTAHPDDTDLLPSAAALPGADDAYQDFVQMTAKVQLTSEERDLITRQDDSKTPDLAAIEPLIARNAEVMALFALFSQRPRLTDPNFADPAKVNYKTPLLQLSPVISAARLSSLRSALLLKQGRAPEALEEAFKIIDASKVLLRSDPPLINAMVGLRMGGIGANRVRATVISGTLDKTQLLDAARRLSAYSNGVSPLQSALRYEYLNASYMVDHIQEFVGSGPYGRWYYSFAARSPSLYQPERTRALLIGRHRGYIESAAKPCLSPRPDFEPVRLAPPNVLGQMMFNLPPPKIDAMYTGRCEHDFRLAAAITTAALEAYRLDKKRYPVMLSTLVPGYLASVPADPFTGAALHYSPDTGEVHSAGKDPDGKPL